MTPSQFVRALLTVFAASVALLAQGPPNVLVIVADDMGYGDLGCYGSKQIATPNLDALAASGARCTDGYVSASVCAPSRAGLLTGRYQNRFGFEHNLISDASVYSEGSLSIPQDEQTIADRLSTLGYATACIGKWHVGEHLDWQLPNQRGFDYFFGMRNGSHGYFPKPGKHRLYRNHQKVQTIDEPYLTDWFTSESIAFIERHEAKQKDEQSDKPWFVYLSYNTPHAPMQCKQQDYDAASHVKNERRRKYVAMQHCMDQNIGRIRQFLDERELTDDTLIVFLSDNGGSVYASSAINAPLRGEKGTFLEGGLRVPMIWSWPGHIEPKQTYQQPVISLDILPTVLAAAGSAIEPEAIGKGRRQTRRIYDGVDLLPFFGAKQPPGAPHESLCWRMMMRGAAVRQGQWKLVRTPFAPPQLYNLNSDIGEQHNLAAEQPSRVTELMAVLTKWEESHERPPMWSSAVMWSAFNRKFYSKTYQLVQPQETPR
ncbi:MAG: arylsulfatase A-like enzyme [Neolewinella sp.]|jgi:arylsulfatase A-like enzyme